MVSQSSYGNLDYNDGITASCVFLKAAEALLEIQVMDVNDNAPEFQQPAYTFMPSGETGLVGAVQV